MFVCVTGVYLYISCITNLTGLLGIIVTNDFIVPFPGNPNVAFEIVRAYPASETAQSYGIYANFSMKVVLLGKNSKMDFASINSLMLKLDQDGVMYVSSKGEKIVTKNGETTIYPFSLFPGANADNGNPEQYDQYVEQIATAVKAFIKHAQERVVKRTEAPKQKPQVIEEICSMGNFATKKPARPSQGEFGDIPV